MSAIVAADEPAIDAVAVTESRRNIRRSSQTTSASTKNRITSIFLHLELLVVAAIVIFPLIWVIGASLGPTGGLANARPIPENATFANYIHLFRDTPFLRWYANSLYVAVGTMIGGVLLSGLCGYVFARIKFRGRKVGLLTLLILQMFPTFLTAIAVYMLFLNFGLLDSLTGLILVSVAGVERRLSWGCAGFPASWVLRRWTGWASLLVAWWWAASG